MNIKICIVQFKFKIFFNVNVKKDDYIHVIFTNSFLKTVLSSLIFFTDWAGSSNALHFSPLISPSSSVQKSIATLCVFSCIPLLTRKPVSFLASTSFLIKPSESLYLKICLLGSVHTYLNSPLSSLRI